MAALPPEVRLIYKFELSRGEFGRIGDETSRLKKALLSIGFPSEASRRALIAAYELGMNIIIHAERGFLQIHWVDGALRIIAQDVGPGIPDIGLAMQEGYSTAPDYVREMGFGAGMGLPNAKKASDSMNIRSEVGRGTSVDCVVLPGPLDRPAMPGFHSVRLDEKRCKGCTNCIKSCPTEAIRVRQGKAAILEDRCIDCGECIRRCPNHAKVAVSDPWERLSDFDYKVALIPPSFYGLFKDLSPSAIRTALMAPGGFDEVLEVSVAADLVSQVTAEYIRDNQGKGPFISPSCPAVLRLIQVKYPALLKQVIPCEAPMEIAAWLAKDLVLRKIGVSNPSAVFISPCPAKITAARQPVGRGRSMVDAAVSASVAYKWVREHEARFSRGGEADRLPARGGAQHSDGSRGIDPSPRQSQSQSPSRARSLGPILSSGLGLGWGRAGGEMEAAGVPSMSVDGVNHVSSVLDEVEKGALDGVISLLEANACPGGCVGGCLNVGNPFVSKMRLSGLAEIRQREKRSPDPEFQAIGSDKPQLWFSLKLSPRPIFMLDSDPHKAEEKLQKLTSIESTLPGLDCGACGAPTCRALAEDIVLDKASLWDCTFILREKLGALVDEVKDLATRRPPAMSREKAEGRGEE